VFDEPRASAGRFDGANRAAEHGCYVGVGQFWVAGGGRQSPGLQQLCVFVISLTANV
jgi:hypothetical protein